MKKTYCDACGKEITWKCTNKFSYLCHIDDILDHKIGYSDDDGNSISGKQIVVDLCNGCYNRVVIESIKKFREIKRDSKLSIDSNS